MSAVLKPAAFTPTAEQAAILDAVRDLHPGGLLKIQARAGTGKTSTLEMLARADARPMLYLAYNADIAAAAKKRFPDTVTVKTTHGLAWAGLCVHEWIPDKGAPRNIRSWEVQRWMAARNWNHPLKTGASPEDVAADALATVRAFMQSADPALSLDHVRCTQRKTRREAFLEHARFENPGDAVLAERNARSSHCRYREWLAEKATALWQAMIDRHDSSVPLEHDAYLKLYQISQPRLDWPLILLDEAQDTNPCVMALFLSQAAAKVMVGDDAQAIYGFRGVVDALKTPGQERPLLQSFRFGPAVADTANLILSFKPTYQAGFHKLRGFLQRSSLLGPVTQPPYTVICRSNQGVFMAALKAASAGLKINSGAKDLEESICYVESAWALMTGVRLAKTHPEIAEFGKWDVLEQESRSDAALQWLVKLVTDLRETMPECCERLRNAKTRMKKSADVLVVTAHKSKGLEFDQVILADDFSALDKPLNKVLQDRRLADEILPELPEQEINLLYVAATRAQHRLQANQTIRTMASLEETLSKIRRKHADGPAEPAPVSDVVQQTEGGDTDRITRMRYLAFPPALKAAMKIAANRFDWCPKTWAQQTEAIAEAMLTGGWTAGELADAYRNPPPPDRVLSGAKTQPATQALPKRENA